MRAQASSSRRVSLATAFLRIFYSTAGMPSARRDYRKHHAFTMASHIIASALDFAFREWTLPSRVFTVARYIATHSGTRFLSTSTAADASFKMPPPTYIGMPRAASSFLRLMTRCQYFDKMQERRLHDAAASAGREAVDRHTATAQGDDYATRHYSRQRHDWRAARWHFDAQVYHRYRKYISSSRF